MKMRAETFRFSGSQYFSNVVLVVVSRVINYCLKKKKLKNISGFHK